jgi:DNA invertase Pin-like site-specific DNA recombinase
MMKAANQRKFDMIMVWSIDRLGRSLQNLVEILNDLQSLRVDLMFLQQGMGIKQIAREVGVGIGTVYSVI